MKAESRDSEELHEARNSRPGMSKGLGDSIPAG